LKQNPAVAIGISSLYATELKKVLELASIINTKLLKIAANAKIIRYFLFVRKF
jgi:hypothetical protein